ncbi:hypothetical protein LXT21_03630 [Myxococcus sp. K38C18041901]|uniref:hypothetical protein n=1 Tax=Myxococcus guangdongensis TaxID=2906760 RepID=UPI0020A72857|nr:hypothetical protein [Myxococcus guangdongensis]MCP3057861.1 hypothetical protein [Myxococcus guangdongensis]
MSDKAGSKRLGWLAGLAGVALVAALVFSLWGEAPPPPPEPEAPVAAPTPPPAPPTPLPEPVKPPGMTSSVIPQTLQAPELEDEQPKPYPLDMEALRARLPDNLYWELGAPTKDPELIRKREEETRRWNEVFGRVQSGDATEAEIQQYYERRRKVSEDMLLFATTVLEEQGDELPERDRGLYELSINMHRTRLSEYSRQEAESLAHRRAQEERRQAWRQQQQGAQTPP